MAGPVPAPKTRVADRPTITLLGEMFPADPVGIGMMLAPMGLAAGPVCHSRMARALHRTRWRRRGRYSSVLHGKHS